VREHATVVEWLVQPVEGQRSSVLEAFLQPVNSLGLKRHLPVAKVDTMERALQFGNAYI